MAPQWPRSIVDQSSTEKVLGSVPGHTIDVFVLEEKNPSKITGVPEYTGIDVLVKSAGVQSPDAA